MKFKEGDSVIYSKTGTAGKILKLHQLDGKIWAELDSTGLLYDENSLEPANELERSKKIKEEHMGKKEITPDLPRDEGQIDSSGNVCGGG